MIRAFGSTHGSVRCFQRGQHSVFPFVSHVGQLVRWHIPAVILNLVDAEFRKRLGSHAMGLRMVPIIGVLSDLQPVFNRLGQEFVQRDAVGSDQKRSLWLEGLGKGREP